MSRRRVVITGMGMVAPLGLTVEENWKNILAGKSGAAPIRHFDARTFPTTFACQVREFDLADYCDHPEDYAKCTSNVRFAIAASRQAYDQSGLAAARFDRERFGIYMAGGEGGTDFPTFTRTIFASIKDGSVDPSVYYQVGMKNYDGFLELEQEPGRVAVHLARLYQALGPNCNSLTACAASTQAIGEAAMAIRRGDVDLMLSGGAHSMIRPLGVMGFNLLTALATEPRDRPETASRPFDRNRSGFVLGEASTMLVLEELSHALARGAPILGEVIGFGSSADAYRMTDIHPEGRGPLACLEAAVADAGIDRRRIDYVNAHGTSTKENDKIETLTLKRFFGDHAKNVPVSSVKSSLGHLIAAGGATELATCVLAIRDRILPPTINYQDPDEGLDLDYVPNVARPAKVDIALSESFGFGGQNNAVIVRRYLP